jgi:hypothetical protein
MSRLSPPRAHGRALLALFALIAAPLATAGAAHAGTYTAWSCRDASGAPADDSDWTTEVHMSDTAATKQCATGGSVVVNFYSKTGGNYPGGSGASAVYRAPSGTTIGVVALDRLWRVTLNGGGDPDYVNTKAYLTNGAAQWLDGCVSFRSPTCYQSPDPSFSFDDAGATSFGFNVVCDGNSDRSCTGDDGGRAIYSVDRAKVQLTDGTDPVVSNVSGTALTDAPVSGAPTLAFTATDVGSGVWQAEVKLDNTSVWGRAVFNNNGGRCTNDGQVAGFKYSVPCKLATSTTLPVDTTKVANGTHTLSATIWDASGNAAVVVSRTITVANPVPAVPSPGAAPVIKGGGTGAPVGSPNGVGDLASARFTKGAATRTATYGKAVTLSGKLVDGKGKSIPGAHVDVLETVSAKGAAQQYVTTVDTDAKGHFAYKPGVGPGRAVSFGYVATVGDASYLAQQNVNLKVKAQVSLAVSEKSATRQTRIRFSGKVVAGALPSGGARVVIETRGKHSWLIVADLNTKPTGTFSWSHKFSVRGNYRFRARVTHASDAPIIGGSSALRPVKVR